MVTLLLSILIMFPQPTLPEPNDCIFSIRSMMLFLTLGFAVDVIPRWFSGPNWFMSVLVRKEQML